jgi:hypothetical protein
LTDGGYRNEGCSCGVVVVSRLVSTRKSGTDHVLDRIIVVSVVTASVCPGKPILIFSIISRGNKASRESESPASKICSCNNRVSHE